MYSAPALWIQWQLGVVAADAYRGAIRLPVSGSRRRWVPMWLVLGYPFAGHNLSRPGVLYPGQRMRARREQQCGGRRRDWPARSRVGLWSYSLYLVHFPVQNDRAGGQQARGAGGRRDPLVVRAFFTAVPP